MAFDSVIPGSNLARANWPTFLSKEISIGNLTWPSSLRMLVRPRPHQRSPRVSAGGRTTIHSAVHTSTLCSEMEGKCSPGSSRLYRLGV